MHPHSSKPLLVYDNACDFCRYWIAHWQHVTGRDRIDYVPYQEVASEFPDIPLSAFESSVQLILENGVVLSGAEAVLRALNKGWLLWCYYHLSGFGTVAEAVYRLIAQHRPFFSAITRWLWGTHTERTSLYFSRWLFLRVLGGIYLIAFLSLWVQIHGLIGSNGILPANQFLGAVRQQVGASGYRLVPTLFWLNPSDLCLHLLCAGGVVLSLALIAGFFPTWEFSRFVGMLSVTRVSWASLPQFPVGCAALRDRILGNFSCTAAHTRYTRTRLSTFRCVSMALTLAAVPIDVRFWVRQTR